MDANQQHRIKALLLQVMSLPEEDRSRVLALECGSDLQLRAEVEALLRRMASSITLTPLVNELAPFMADGDVVADRYRIVRFLGAGGMGSVYEANDTVLGVQVALKTLRPELSLHISAMHRFKREVQLARSVTHPNVCRVFDVGMTDGTDGQLVFLSMELLRGETLQTFIDRNSPISLAQALPILRQIAEGVDAAHQVNVVHGDLKPSNIMLVPSAGADRAVITDFGLAREYSSRQDITITGTVVGTPGYMAPEQLAGEARTPASDIYALGLIALAMLTGDPHTRPGSRRFREHFGSSGSWNRVFSRVLADPSDRFTHAIEFIDRLESPARSILARAGLGKFVRLWAATSAAVLAIVLLSRQTELRRTAISELISIFTKSLAKVKSLGAEHWASAFIFLAVLALLVGAKRWLPRVRSLFLVIGKAILNWQQLILLTHWRTDTNGRQVPQDSRAEAKHSDERKADQRGDPTVAIESFPSAASSASNSSPPGAPPGFTQYFGVDESRPFPIAYLAILTAADEFLIGSSIQIDRSPFPIGRAQGGLSVARDPTVSREHAFIRWTGSCFTIRDLGTTNGTYVNGRRLIAHKDEVLFFGTDIRISRTTTLRFSTTLIELPDFTGQRLGDRYLLKRLLRASSKVALYEGEDSRPTRRVAVKLLSPTLSTHSGYAEMFEREASTAAQLSHPNIGKILDYGRASLTSDSGEAQSFHYIAMQLLEGGTLGDRLDDPDHFELHKVTSWLATISEALQEAHENGVVHAGLKPSSIVFSAAGTPYLTDFAIAIRPSGRNGPALLGDPNYLAPEQWNGSISVPESDQYSLATLVFRNLAGGFPYEGQQDPEKRSDVYTAGPTSLDIVARHHRRPKMPPSLNAVLARALSKDPKDRYPSVLEFALSFRNAKLNAKFGRTIFISYRREPSAGWAVLIARLLREKYEIESFVDTQRIDGVVRIPEKIEKAIRQCDCFVCLLARQTLKSQWVLEEIRIAAQAGKPMIPLFYESFRRPSNGSIPDHVSALLNHEGVRVYAEYDEAAVSKLARIIKSQWSGQESE